MVGKKFGCVRRQLSIYFEDLADIDIDSNTPMIVKIIIMYTSARHVIVGNLNIIPDERARNIISKGPKYRFPSNIDFSKCRREIDASLNDFSNRWCKQENVKPDALNGRLSFLKLLILLFHFSLVIHVKTCYQVL